MRDFLDNVMVRTDGCYVAGFRVGGTPTYFADDDGRNEAKSSSRIAFARACPNRACGFSSAMKWSRASTDCLTNIAMHHARNCRRFALWTRDALRHGRRRRSKARFLTRIAGDLPDLGSGQTQADDDRERRAAEQRRPQAGAAADSPLSIGKSIRENEERTRGHVCRSSSRSSPASSRR